MTGSALVLPVHGSVARTLSPGLTFSMGLVFPLARRTRVPATKLLHARLSSLNALLALMKSLTLVNRSLASPQRRLLSLAAFTHFHGAPYLASTLPMRP